jgi:hypothetical protein
LFINCNIPAAGSLGNEFLGIDTLYRTYQMPTDLNGSYYLVVFGDVTDKFTSENDESNNLFYTTSQEPLFFQNGVGGRRSVANDRFLNPLNSNQLLSKTAGTYRTAVNEAHRNAYTPDEIIAFLKKEVKNGGLASKISIAKQKAGSNQILKTLRSN